jgi:ATP/maltotriose-dependent transcriptional regulator MalT
MATLEAGLDSTASTDMKGFVGREPELARLRAALDAAQAGHPRLVLMEGPAGIGKTTLIGRFLDMAGDVLVLRAGGAELEQSLAFGVVEQLVAGIEPLPDQLGRLAVHDSRQVEPLAIGAGLVELLGVLQDDGPVVLAVDDAQWADTASLQALAFAVRRLRIDQVLVIVCTRDAADPRLAEGLQRSLLGLDALHLGLQGLDLAGLGRLAIVLGAGELSQGALKRLHAHTQGNPLHARALLQELPAQALHDPLHPLPAPRSFALLVVSRLARCPAGTVDLLAAAAILGMSCPLDLAARLVELQEPLAAVEQAIAEGLLEERSDGPDMTVSFPHPLIHAAVYRAVGPARRVALHRRAATLVGDEAMALGHRVRASSGPDARLAAELVAFARRQVAAAAWASAAEALLAAARLTQAPSDRERLLLEAAECLQLAGDVAEAARLSEQLTAQTDSGWRDYVHGRLALVAGHLQEAEARLVEAWRRSDLQEDASLGARIAGQLAYLSLMTAHGLDSVQWAGRALELDPAGTASGPIRYLELVGLAIAGHPEEALTHAAQLPDPETASDAELDALVGRGLVRTWTDDLAEAHRDLTRLAAVAQARAVPFRILVLAALAQVEYRCGHWDDAIMHAEVASSLVDDSGHFWLAPYCRAIAAYVHAARGQWTAAEAHLAAGWAAIGQRSYPAGVAFVGSAEAHLRHAQHDPQRVIAALEPVLALQPRDGTDEPGVVPWADLLVEALVVVGNRDEAEALLVQIEQKAADRNRRSVLAAAARARGSLEAARGNQNAAEHAFQRGLLFATQVADPFGQALVMVAYGACLRRAGRRGAAAGHLQAAHELLTRLDAHPYLERCDRELAGCGLTPAKRTPSHATRLTPQELAIARLVARGLTNQQVAAELVVSVKTVEYHLGKVYAKLAITSRTQLQGRLDPLGSR